VFWVVLLSEHTVDCTGVFWVVLLSEHTVDCTEVFWVVLLSEHTLLQLVTFLTALLFICFRVPSCLLTPSSLILRRDTRDTPLLCCLL